MGDLARECALRGVIFYEIGQVISGYNVTHCHHIDVLAYEALFHHRPIG